MGQVNLYMARDMILAENGFISLPLHQQFRMYVVGQRRYEDSKYQCVVSIEQGCVGNAHKESFVELQF